MKLDLLLSSLQKVRKTGPNRWVACCPAHSDKSPSLSITANSRTVLLKCFADCDTESILSAIGMTFDDLYPAHLETVKPGRIPATDALRCVAYESLVVIASAGTMRERDLTEEEAARLSLASARIQAAIDLAGLQ